MNPPPEQANPRRVLLQAVGAASGILLAILALGWLAREPIEAFSRWMVVEWGLPGLIALTVLVDPVPGPGHDTALVVGYAGGLGFWPVWIATAIGTQISSWLCWGLGRLIGHWGWVQRLLTRWKVKEFLDRHGSRAIALASVLPVPYGPVTVGAGASGMPLRTFMIGAAARPLKVLAALAMIAAGWHLTG